MKFKPGNISARLSRLPMVKALIPLIAGIVFFDSFEADAEVVWGCFLLSLLTAAITIRRNVGSAYIVAAIFFLGGGAVSLGRFTPALPYGEMLFMEIEADETVVPRSSGYGSTPATVRTVETRDGITAVGERIMLWCDSTLTVGAGDRIACIGRIRPFDTGYRSYARLMSRRGFAGTLFLNRDDVTGIMKADGNSLHTFAVERLSRLNLKDDALASVGAMAVGDRRHLTPEMRKAYSRSGASHVLAVSGLHVGIIFMLANTLLRWVTALRHGQSIRAVAVIIPVWLYAAACGFPPSVIRAALMFTVLQAAVASTSTYVGLNTLAAAAFAMLLYDADMLFDISFQLSFVAVAAIMLWAVPLSRLAEGRNRAIRMLWGMTAAGAAATIATAPIISHTFGTVSLVGLAANPLVILCANITVIAAAIWIVMPVPWLAPLFGGILDITASVQNSAVEWLASLPWAAAEVTLPTWAVTVSYTLMTAATLAAWCIEPEKKVTLPR